MVARQASRPFYTQVRQIHSTIRRHGDAFIVSAARTPVGSMGGSLKDVPATRLGSIAVRAAIDRANLQPEHIEDGYIGNVIASNLGQAPARQVILGAGCPHSTEATTINKVCSSGMKTITLAAQNIYTGHRDVMVAGGMESMSNIPYYFPRGAQFGNVTAYDGILRDGLTDVYDQIHMGNCAENTAKKIGVSREEQDNFAIESYKRAQEAIKNGAFDKELVSVPLKKGEFTQDEEPGRVKLEKIPTLRTVFQKDGTITAANASSLNDGASALVVASEEGIKRHNLQPMARIVSFADAACAPIDFPLAPTLAIPKALEKAGLTLKDISKIEVNEAFSAVSKAIEKVLDLDPSKTNVLGGAVALGHPIGSSGSRIVVTLTHLLKPGEYGLAGICNGGGGATAMVIQRI